MKRFLLSAIAVIAAFTSYDSIAQELPAHYFENNYIQKRIKSIPKGKSFIFICDSHVQRNAGNQTQLPAYIMSKAKVGLTVFGGDCFDWAPDVAKAKDYLSTTFQEYEKAFGDKFLWIQGNHDCNSSAVTKYKIPYQTAEVNDRDAYELTIGHMADRIVQDREAVSILKGLNLPAEDLEESQYWSKMHYYYDDASAKIRYIVIESDDRGHTTKRIIKNKTLVEIQNAFLKAALESTPNGYDVVVAGHMFVSGADGPLKQYARWMKTACDFRKAGKGRIIMLCGHTHIDDTFAVSFDDNGKLKFTELANGAILPKDALLLTTISCDANASYQKYASGGSPKILLQKSKAHYPMKKETVSEHAFDVVTLAKHRIQFTRIGAGEDRYFKY